MSKSKKKAIVKNPVKPFQEENISSDQKWKYLISAVALISFGLSIFNNYVLDDFIVIVKNSYTQRGFAGIWDILSKDTFAGMTESNIMVLSGGRYRPLSLVTFAIEHQLFGNTAFLSHLINLAIYIFCGILLFNFLKRILSFRQIVDKNHIAPVSAAIALLFVSLPAHSEPVINIKGRDDLMCLMFFLLASIQMLQYISTGKKKNILFSFLFYFLSLMSKETALTFIAAFPLILYFITNADSKKISNLSLSYLFLALLFLLFRYLATMDNSGIPSKDVLNDPFVNAGLMQKYATIFLSWLYYLKLFIYPLHLSYDYNFNQFPLTSFTDWHVILSVFIHTGMFFYAIFTFRKKSIYSFAILFYFITFSILSNFFFNIGTIFADRFILISSIGLCIVAVLLVYEAFLYLRAKQKNNILEWIPATLLILILILFSFRNIARCSDWKDNNTLFIADTDEAPNSAKIQLNAGIAFLTLSDIDTLKKDSLLRMALIHLQKGIDIYPTFIDGYMNMGVTYSRLGDLSKAEEWWNKARKIDPNHSSFRQYNIILRDYYFNRGLQNGVDRKFSESITNMKNALAYDSLNADILYNIGGAYFTLQNTDSAVYYFQKSLKVNPDLINAQQALQAIQMQRFKR
jgi:tetratricopeptide (TPR) repeat protein